MIDHYVDTVADLVADSTEPVAVIGNSLGAVTALAFASAHPRRTDRVVLSDMPGLAGIPPSLEGERTASPWTGCRGCCRGRFRRR